MTAGDFHKFISQNSSGTMADGDLEGSQGIAGAPNEAALLKLMERTGYAMLQENGQRKYGGPPPGWPEQQPAPVRGCEVFVGKIPRDCYEDELVPIFERMGRIYELRLMMDFSGTNRGYCFVMYCSRNDAKRAVRELNNYEIRRGRFVGVCLSVDNCRLFVGGIPKSKRREEILEEMSKVTEGVNNVIVYPSATDKTKNRGFAFVEFESHRAAAMARRKLIPGRIQLWGHQIAVDWAEPELDVDEDIMSKVKILYVRNLMLSTTEEKLEQEFNNAAGSNNAIERVKKIRDYAFIHFREREDALTSMNMMNGGSLDGSIIEVCLAKPVDKNEGHVRYTRQAALTPGTAIPQVPTATMPYALHFPNMAGGDPGLYAAYYNQMAAANAAAAVTAGRPLGLQQVPTVGTTMGQRTVPMSRGPMRGRGRGAAGSRAAGGLGRGQVPGYLRATPAYKKPVEMLEEICHKNGWGSPIYQLLSTSHKDGSRDYMQLFVFKVAIPGLASHSFQSDKLCPTSEQAKNHAAEYVLLQLGMPTMPAIDSTNTAVGMNPTVASNNATASAIAAQQLAYSQQQQQQQQQQYNAAAAQQQFAAAAAAQQMNAAAASQYAAASSQYAAASPMMSTSPDNATTALYQGHPIAAGAYQTMNGAPSPAAQQSQQAHHSALMAAAGGDLALATSSIPMVSSTMGTPSYVTIGNHAAGTATKLGSPNAGLQTGFGMAFPTYAHY